jgi:hypothetical protein
MTLSGVATQAIHWRGRMHSKTLFSVIAIVTLGLPTLPCAARNLEKKPEGKRDKDDEYGKN